MSGLLLDFFAEVEGVLKELGEEGFKIIIHIFTEEDKSHTNKVKLTRYSKTCVES